MGKKLHNDVYDASLDKIATGVNLTFTSSEPADYASIAAVALISTTLTAGDGNGDYTISDGATSGRKLTVASQTGLSPSSSGTVTHVCIDDGITLLACTTVNSQAINTGENWDSPAFNIEMQDPS